MNKDELKALSDNTFTDNNTGDIQPSGHRNFNNVLIDFIDAMLVLAKNYANEKVADIVNSAPEALDTLQELANALGNDPNFSATVMQMIGERVTTEALNTKLNEYLPKTGGNIDQLTVGNLPVCKVHGATDFNNIVSAAQSGVHGGLSKNDSSTPDEGYGNLLHLKAQGRDAMAQIYIGFNPLFAGMWFRGTNDGSLSAGKWNSAWKRVWDSGNFDPTMFPKQDAKGSRVETDCNKMTVPGTYDINSAEQVFSNAPFTSYGQIFTVCTKNSVMQIAAQYDSAILYWRSFYGGTNSISTPWRKLFDNNSLKPATTSANGLMSAEDKTKLDKMPRVVCAGVINGTTAETKIDMTPTGWFCTKGERGIYNLTHNANTLNYLVFGTSHAAGNCTIMIEPGTKGKNACRLNSSGTTWTDADFDIMVVAYD